MGNQRSVRVRNQSRIRMGNQSAISMWNQCLIRVMNRHSILMGLIVSHPTSPETVGPGCGDIGKQNLPRPTGRLQRAFLSSRHRCRVRTCGQSGQAQCQQPRHSQGLGRAHQRRLEPPHQAAGGPTGPTPPTRQQAHRDRRKSANPGGQQGVALFGQGLRTVFPSPFQAQGPRVGKGLRALSGQTRLADQADTQEQPTRIERIDRTGLPRETQRQKGHGRCRGHRLTQSE